MKIPQRFNLIPAYLANRVRPLVNGPGFLPVLRFLSQPGKEARANRFISNTEVEGDWVKVSFLSCPQQPLYYPTTYRWVDFCQTVDECFNEENWHHFLSPRFTLTEQDVVVDCGAAEGLFTLTAAMRGATVHAFEPDLRFAEAMRKSFAALEKVQVHHCAAGHKTGKAYLSRDEIFSRIAGEKNGVEIAIRTLDDALNGQEVTFIKADVEGFEFRVLLGAEALIRQHRPRLALTVYHPQNNVAEIQDFLKECCEDYQFATKGLYDNGHPVMFHAWVDR